jgi:hypothetical protein
VCVCTCGDRHGFKVVGQGRDQPQAQTPLRARTYTAAPALLLWQCQLTVATRPALSLPLASQSPRLTLSTQRADIHWGGAGLGAALVGAAGALQRPPSARPRGRLHLPQSACQTRGASTRSAPEHTPAPVCSRTGVCIEWGVHRAPPGPP